MEGTAFILVRSVVANPDDRKAFDHWYQPTIFLSFFPKSQTLIELGVFGVRVTRRSIIPLESFQK